MLRDEAKKPTGPHPRDAEFGTALAPASLDDLGLNTCPLRTSQLPTARGDHREQLEGLEDQLRGSHPPLLRGIPASVIANARGRGSGGVSRAATLGDASSGAKPLSSRDLGFVLE